MGLFPTKWGFTICALPNTIMAVGGADPQEVCTSRGFEHTAPFYTMEQEHFLSGFLWCK